MEKFKLKSDDEFRRRVISSMGYLLGSITLLAIWLRCSIALMGTSFVLRTLFLNAGLFLVPFFIRRGFGTVFCGNFLIACMFGIGFNCGLINGGIRAPATILFVILPIIGFFCSGERAARFALSLSVLGIVALLLGETYPFIMPLNHPEKYAQYKALILFFITAASYGIGAAYERSRRISEKTLEDVSLRAANAAKMSSLGEMAAGIAHEINNPLAIVSGRVGQIKRMLEMSDLVDKSKFSEELVKIENTVQRMAKIVYGLRTFSRNAETDAMVRTNVATIIEETLALCSERFKHYNVEVRVVCESTIQADCRSAQISQVVLNLLNNAFDAIDSLTEKWVEVKVAVNKGKIQISVTDSGKGIPPEIAAKMVEPFYTTKAVGKGTGLGLSISSGICQQHGGELKYDSSCPNTRFIIELPSSAGEPVKYA